MNKVLVLVEGQTERDIVYFILTPHLETHGVYITPTVINTKRVKSGPNFKGGVLNYQQVTNDLKPLFNDTSASLITTMLDLYHLPTDFPNHSIAMKKTKAQDRVESMTDSFREDFISRHAVKKPERFYPYISLYEVEALLFASPYHIDQNFPNAHKESDLEKIRSAFLNPEEINADFPPSKRLLELFPSYDKPLAAVNILQSMSLDIIRQACPHFNQWLTKLEQVGS